LLYDNQYKYFNFFPIFDVRTSALVNLVGVVRERLDACELVLVVEAAQRAPLAKQNDAI
jgi:hypothetical protein